VVLWDWFYLEHNISVRKFWEFLFALPAGFGNQKQSGVAPEEVILFFAF
jgi:hypothetical protein